MGALDRQRAIGSLAFAAIADDFTGAVDLAGMVARTGLRSLIAIGPESVEELRLRGAQALTVALKTRSVDAEQAVQMSLAAAAALRDSGAAQLYFKYCSTFDSTQNGNIGPVSEALRAMLHAGSVPFVPAFPENGRRVYRGHLFVGDALLHESGMQSHPLNPMRDSNLCRVLASQSRAATASMPLEIVRQGAVAVRLALEAHAIERPLVIVDAIEDTDLEVIGAAISEWPLVTGGSALGQYIACQRIGGAEKTARGGFTIRPGRFAILTGSCSQRTREQIRHFSRLAPTFAFSSRDVLDNPHRLVDRALCWLDEQPADRPMLIGSDGVTANDPRIASAMEGVLGEIAQHLVSRGVSQLVIAGGETAGTVLTALNPRGLEIGAEIAPGVSWSRLIGGPADGMVVALKSGNFGPEDFFYSAFARLTDLGDAA